MNRRTFLSSILTLPLAVKAAIVRSSKDSEFDEAYTKALYLVMAKKVSDIHVRYGLKTDPYQLAEKMRVSRSTHDLMDATEAPCFRPDDFPGN